LLRNFDTRAAASPFAPRGFFTAIASWRCDVKNNAFLSGLNRWQNDKDHFRHIERFARSGDVDAMYALGLLFIEGRGVGQDYVIAYKWLNLAAINGDKDSYNLLYMITPDMTAEQIKKGEELIKQHEALHANASQPTNTANN
jgi:TPR repeat protein